MKDDNLGKMGGRRSRDRKTTKSELDKLLELKKIVNGLDVEKQEGVLEETSQLNAITQAVGEGIRGIELNIPLLEQYVQLIEADYEESLGHIEPVFTGYLLTEIARRNKAQGKPTEIYFNGRGIYAPGLFSSAKGIDLLVLENVNGEGILRDAEVKKCVITTKDCALYHADELCILIKAQRPLISRVSGTLIMKSCEAPELSLGYDSPGCIIADDCGGLAISTFKKGVKHPKGLYCRGDLSLTSNYCDDEESNYPAQLQPGLIEESIITGICTIAGKEIDDRAVKKIVQGELLFDEESFQNVYGDHELHLLEELKDPDVPGERKIEIVKIIDEARYR